MVQNVKRILSIRIRECTMKDQTCLSSQGSPAARVRDRRRGRRAPRRRGEPGRERRPGGAGPLEGARRLGRRQVHTRHRPHPRVPGRVTCTNIEFPNPIPSFARFRHVLFWEFPCPAWAVAKVATYGHMYRAEPKEPTQFGSVSGLRYKMSHFPIVVPYLCVDQNQKNQPNLVLYLVRRSKIFVSVATLPMV